MNDSKTIVIDIGTRAVKAGFAGDDLPQTVFPSIIGKRKYCAIPLVIDRKDYIGEEACSKAGILNLSNIINHGIVNNWVNMEKILDHAFHQLEADPSDHPVLISEAIRTSNKDREKMAEIMFEKFEIPSYFIAKDSVLSLISTHYTSGIVLDIGAGCSTVVSIYEGQYITPSQKRIDFGGINIDEYMYEMLHDRGLEFEASAEKEILRDMKEKFGYVALDFEEEMKKVKKSSDYDVSYKLPCSNYIILSQECFRCGELLFNPSLNHLDFDGVHKLLYDSINKTSSLFHRYLYSHIVLCGGSTKFQGFSQRFEKEYNKLDPNAIMRFLSQTNPEFSAWIGGSLLASKDNIRMFSKNDYIDCGPHYLHSYFIN